MQGACVRDSCCCFDDIKIQIDEPRRNFMLYTTARGECGGQAADDLMAISVCVLMRGCSGPALCLSQRAVLFACSLASASLFSVCLAIATLFAKSLRSPLQLQPLWICPCNCNPVCKPLAIASLFGFALAIATLFADCLAIASDWRAPCNRDPLCEISPNPLAVDFSLGFASQLQPCLRVPCNCNPLSVALQLQPSSGCLAIATLFASVAPEALAIAMYS